MADEMRTEGEPKLISRRNFLRGLAGLAGVAAGKTSINFAPKSLVSAEGVIQSVLRNTKGVTFDLSTLIFKTSASPTTAPSQ